MFTHNHPKLLAIAWMVLAVLTLVVPLLFSTATVDVFEENKAMALILSAILLVGLAIASWWGYWENFSFETTGFVRGLARDWVRVGVLLFVGSAALSTLFSLNPWVSWGGTDRLPAGLQTILAYTVLFFVARSLCHTVESVRRWLLLVLVAGTIVSVYAVLQACKLDPVAWNSISQINSQERPIGTMGHANHLGGFLAMVLPLACWFSLDSFRRGRKGFGVGFLLGGGLLFVVLMLTLSRGAWLAGICALLVVVGYWILRGQSLRRSIALGAGLLIVLGLASAVFLLVLGQRFQSVLVHRALNFSVDAGRLPVWRASWEMFLANPVLGSGLDTFGLAFGQYRPVEYLIQEHNKLPGKAHNEFLHILATQGLVGVGATLVLLVGVIRAGLLTWKRYPERRSLISALGAMMLAFLVQNAFGFVVVGTGVVFVVVLAILSSWSSEPNAPVPDSSEQSWRWGLLIGMGLVGVVLIGNLGVSVALSCLLCASVVCVGYVWLFDTPTVERSQVPTRSMHPPWLAWTSVAFVTCVVCWFFVARPWYARWLCGQTDRLAEHSPAKALLAYREASQLDESARTWSRIASTAETLAEQTDDATEYAVAMEEAESALRRAVALVPENAYHHANLARFLGSTAKKKRSRREEALAAWESALAREPRNVDLLTEATRTALGVGEYERAQRFLHEGQRLYPNLAVFDAQEGAMHYALGQSRRAVASLRKALSKDWLYQTKELTRALALLSAVHLGLGEYEQARILAWQAHRRDPAWPTPLLLAGQANVQGGRREQAKACYRKVLELNPLDSRAKQALAVLLSKDS